MKKFFPLWFADIIKTEQKLSELSGKGLHMTDLSPFMGIFTFENGDNTKELYRICPAKGCRGEPPKGLASGGWEKVCGGKNYYVVKNPDTDTKNIPSYSKWKTYNRISLYIAFMFFCFVLGLLSGFAMGVLGKILDGLDAGDLSAEYVNKYDIMAVVLMFTVGVIPMIRLFISNRRLAKTDTDLNLKGKVIKTIPEENFIYTPEEEKQMLKDGRMMKKVPIGWFYAPDKAEEMVEKLAAEGWKFYRFNPLGTVFYFIKSEPCKIKFVVDYQNEAQEEYFMNGKDDGWKLEFTSVSRLQCFVVWTKEYDDASEPPEFYSDGETKLKHAKRMAYTFGITFSVCGAIIIGSGIMVMGEYMKESIGFLVYFTALYSVLLAEFSFFAAKTIGFYIRTKRRYNNNK